MPRLIRIDKESSRWNGVGHAGKRGAYPRVVGKQLIEPGNDADGRARCDRGKARTVEGVALDERGDAPEALGEDQGRAVPDVQVAVVAQQNRIGACRGGVDRLEHIPAMAGGDIQDPYRQLCGPRLLHRLAQQLFDMQLALTDSTPSDRPKIVGVDHRPECGRARRMVAVDVVERAARIETGPVPEADALGKHSAQP